MNTVTHLNGHASHRALHELRNAKAQVGNALHLAAQYLEMARMTTHIHGLNYDIPSDRAIAELRDTIERELTGTPPQRA